MELNKMREMTDAELAAELEKMKNNINSDESSRELVEVDLEGKGNTLSYIFNFKES